MPRTMTALVACVGLILLVGCQEDEQKTDAGAAASTVSESDSAPQSAHLAADPEVRAAATVPTAKPASKLAFEEPVEIALVEPVAEPSQSATAPEELAVVVAQPDPNNQVLDEPREAKDDGFDYYAVRLSELALENDKGLPRRLMEVGPDLSWLTRNGVVRLVMSPPAEGYITGMHDTFNVQRDPSSRVLARRQQINSEVVVRVPHGKSVGGVLFVNIEGLEDWRARGEDPARLAFSLKKSQVNTSQVARDSYWLARAQHFDSLLNADVPGAAWHRHQLAHARGQLPDLKFQPNRRWRRAFGSRQNDVEETYALLSGGRALAENLQLDRQLPPAADLEPVVPVESIRGITIREFDWKPLISELQPQLDPLAPLIPADQHVLFIPSFRALVRILDEAAENGAPVLNLSQVRAEDAQSQKRYERQLGLSLDAVTRLLGPSVIRSVAITGGDLYLRTGSDVAVVFEAVDAESLVTLLTNQLKTKAGDHPTAQLQQGECAGVGYRGYLTDDRTISSYMARLGSAVVVTNSLVQLEKLITTFQDEQPSLDELDEYVFFRDRYPLDNPDQAGLLILSDMTIRRWCGPRWRIASARRTQAVARMTQLQADLMDALVSGDVTAELVKEKSDGLYHLGPDGVNSTVFGSLEFQTPISELLIDKVSSEEQRLYERWRNGYQRQWSNFFDPIAIELTLSDNSLAADVTVMPLIDGSDYQELIQISRGVSLAEGAGDRHPEALAHAVLALNKESEWLSRNLGLARQIAPQISVDPLSWLGNEITIYADKSEFWEELKDLGERELERHLEENIHRLPVGVGIGVSNGIKLTVFLAGLRAFIDQTAPGMTRWETREHREQSYVAIRPTEQALGSLPDSFAVFYRATGRQLLLSLNEDIIKRSIERELAPDQEQVDQGGEVMRPWLGESVGFQLGPSATSFLKSVFKQHGLYALQEISWSNIPILNEWQRLYPDRDPVEIHQIFWQRRLVCPGGGEYVWNEELQTMESTVFGSPVAPRAVKALPAAIEKIETANLGLSFEPHGLRAQIQLGRKSTGKP